MQDSTGGAKKILVIEDEPAISQICRRVLAEDGFEVDTAINGEVAQGMLGEGDYNLLFIDIGTPVMNGKEFYQCLKEKYPGLADSVVFTTGDVIGGTTRDFLEKSGRPFLPKPFTPDELKAIIRETLRQAEK